MTVKKRLPITCASRNAMWIYPRAIAPRFAGAPTITEITRTHEMPDFAVLPDGADVEVELYGGAVSLFMRGDVPRVYIERFVYVTYGDGQAAREAFLSLWRRVERLESAAEVKEAARRWLEAEPERSQSS